MWFIAGIFIFELVVIAHGQGDHLEESTRRDDRDIHATDGPTFVGRNSILIYINYCILNINTSSGKPFQLIIILTFSFEFVFTFRFFILNFEFKFCLYI